VSFDYDNDGDLDAYIANHGAKPVLYRNDGGNDNDWLRIKLEGTESNRSGLGAFITLDPNLGVMGDELVREVNGGSTFLGHNELIAHFGLGAESAAVDQITIEWPSGAVQTLANVAVNQLLTVVERSTPGDFDGNGVVDGHDFLAWQRGESPNGLVADDLAEWKAAFAGGASIVSSSVPEPSTAVLLTIGGVLGNRRRRTPN
jgi:hypothetical protein